MRAPKPVDHQFESEQLSVVFGNLPIDTLGDPHNLLIDPPHKFAAQRPEQTVGPERAPIHNAIIISLPGWRQYLAL